MGSEMCIRDRRKCVSYHVIPEALSVRELKAKCEDERLMTLSDDDDALTLHCRVTQQVSKRYKLLRHLISTYTHIVWLLVNTGWAKKVDHF